MQDSFHVCDFLQVYVNTKVYTCNIYIYTYTCKRRFILNFVYLGKVHVSLGVLYPFVRVEQRCGQGLFCDTDAAAELRPDSRQVSLSMVA